MAELREEEFPQLQQERFAESAEVVADCVIDTDFEVLIPDSYVENVSERIRLYRELDGMTNESQWHRFEIEMRDRFGELPLPVKGLISVVQIRQFAQSLGVERVLAKRGKMVLYFLSDQQAAFYSSPAFMNILSFVQRQLIPGQMNERNDKLTLSFESVNDIERARYIVQEMYTFVYGEK